MDRKSLFMCPVCKNALTQGEKQYFCKKGHTFDISRKGYVNLLLPVHTGSGDPGDSREMLQCRRDFLKKGYYGEFSDKLNEMLRHNMNLTGSPVNILDAGCGEGYYLWRLKNSLSSEIGTDKIAAYGIDVSKPAVHYASGRDRSIFFAVASTYHLPLLSSSMDCIMCVFAPRDESEIRRVLKPSGILLIAAPGPQHLYGLREKLYDSPDEIGQKGTAGSDFKLLEHFNSRYGIHLMNNSDIINLLNMTPYSRHTSPSSLENLKKLEELPVEVDINIRIYRKA